MISLPRNILDYAAELRRSPESIDTVLQAIQDNFDALALSIFGRAVAAGVVVLGPGGVDAFTSQTLTVTHGLQVNRSAVVPQQVFVTAQFGDWVAVNAGNYTSTTFQLTGRTVAGGAHGNWPGGGIAVNWMALG